MDLEEIQLQLQKIKVLLNQASEIILTEDVSRYPIFIVNEEEVPLGIQIIQKGDNREFEHNVHASTLEEFYVKKMIQEDKIEDFKKAYKSAETHLCVFWVTDDAAKFIFIEK
ncbi:MAG: hypothetical protein ACOYOA_11005 [Saprospiraceae bacterium]